MKIDPLTKEEAQRLIDATGGKGYIGARDRAFFGTLYRCGLRSNECVMLELDDLRMGAVWSLRIRHPKGASRGAMSRETGLDEKMKGYMDAWLDMRGMAPGPLFLTTKRTRMETSHYRRRIKWVGKQAGITRRVHLHGLRHTFARTLMDEGVNMRLIQLALGHSDLGTTERYLQGVGSKEVIELIAGREW